MSESTAWTQCAAWAHLAKALAYELQSVLDHASLPAKEEERGRALIKAALSG